MFIEKVFLRLRNHSKRKDLTVKSIELQIVQDADWIALEMIRSFFGLPAIKRPSLDKIEFVLSERQDASIMVF